MSPIEEKWEETLLIPPPNVAPMWGRMQNSLRLHSNNKECTELARCQARMPENGRREADTGS